MENSRREFMKKTLAGTALVSAGGIVPGFSAASYNRIIGANDKIRVSIMGVNSRGMAHAQNFSKQTNCEVVHICDVDSRAMDKCIKMLDARQNFKAKGFKDFRQSLATKDIDALVIAAPDHWHAPAGLLALQADKHVYIEKPLSHNPNEGEMLIKASQRYNKVIQMGNQRRSYPNIMAGISGAERWSDRPCLFRERLVHKQPPIHWDRQRNSSAGVARLGSLAGTGTQENIQR